MKRNEAIDSVFGVMAARADADRRECAAAKKIWKDFEHGKISRNKLFDLLKPYGWKPSEIRFMLDG